MTTVVVTKNKRRWRSNIAAVALLMSGVFGTATQGTPLPEVHFPVAVYPQFAIIHTPTGHFYQYRHGPDLALLTTVTTVTSTGAGNWPVVSGASAATFEAWGGGASGGPASGTGQGAGGGGGQYFQVSYSSLTTSDTIYYSVGAAQTTKLTAGNQSWFQKNTNSSSGAWIALGGGLGAGGGENDGTDGGTKVLYFSGTGGASAQGGGGSRGGSGGSGSSGKDGSSVTGTVGSSSTGGAGATGDNTSGGAGGASSGNAGTDHVEGGGGGAGGNGGGSAGSNGGAPGGGGGGAGSGSGVPGNGARGQIRYTFTVVATPSFFNRQAAMTYMRL